jgi:translocation and assembly module TamB
MSKELNTELNKESGSAPMPGSIAETKIIQPLRRGLKWIKNSFRFAVYLPLLLLILLAMVLGTPIGSQFGVMLANQFVPGLNLSYTSGTLNREVHFSKASWALDDISVDASELSLTWQASCLLNWQICVDDLNAASVTVSYIDNSPEPTNSPEQANSPEPINSSALKDTPDSPYEFAIPINISLKKAQLNQVAVQINDIQVNASKLTLRAIWNESGLSVRKLNTAGLKVVLPSTSSDETPLNAKALGQLALKNLPAVYMPFPITLKQLNADDSQLLLGTRQDNFSNIRLSGSYKGYQIRFSELSFAHDYGKGTLKGKLALKDNYPLTIEADLHLDKVTELPELKEQQLIFSATQDLSQLKLNAKVQGQTSFDLEGEINLTSPLFDYQLSLSNAQLQWPLDQGRYQAKVNTLFSAGNLLEQSLSLQAILSTQDQDDITISTELNHRDETLTLSSLSLASKAGQATVQGSISYQQALQWQAEVQTQSLQLEHLLAFTPNFSGKDKLVSSDISGQFTSQGKVSKDEWHFTLTQANLAGSLNGYPMTIKGDISVNSQWNLIAEQLEASALGAKLSMHGKVHDTWDVNAQLSVPDLSQWLTKGLGSIVAAVNVSGKQADPLVTIQTELNAFSAFGISADYAQLTGSYSPLTHHAFALVLKNNRINWKKYQLNDLIITAQGDLNKQSMAISSTGSLAINSQLSSQYDAVTATVRAKLETLSLDGKLGQWRTDKPTELVWNNTKRTGSLSPVCLVHPQSSLCVVAPIELGKQGQVNLSAKGNPGQLLAPILSKKMRWDGEAVLTSQIQWREGEKPTAALDFVLLPGNITLLRTQNNQVSLDYQKLVMSLNLDAEALSSKISFDSQGIAKWESLITIANDADKHLSGTVNIDSLNLQPFGEFFPQLATLEGIISTKLAIKGTLAEPDVSGNINLSDGALAITSNPTLIDKLYINLTLAGQQGALAGHWNMGKGEAKVAGTLAWPQGQFSGDIDISGENLAVIQPPLAILAVSPTMNLAFNKRQLAVKGDIAIPSGQIKIVQLAEGGVAVSGDVVFQDSIAAQEVKTSPYAIIADLSIDVGNELSIDGLGLTGKLAGKLVLKQKAFKPPLMYGDIKVKKGSYRFMGQTLKISTGEVQFVGSPENPNLNIQAVRKIKDEDLIAGVRITGTPLRPVVTLFSNPAKEQAEILSYILKGTGFSSSNNQQNNALMMSAALSLSSQYDGGAINNIGSTASGLIEKFGFSNVQLDANDEGRVAVSGYIGEDLMVKYGMGVFNPGYEMTVRYYLLSQLYLETVSSTLSQSLDIYYSFDID